jgi:sortase A
VGNFLLIAGLAAVDVWIWSNAVATIYQSWQDRAFQREVEAELPAGESAPLAEGPSEPKSPVPRKDGGLVGRLFIPRLRLRAVVAEGTGEDTLSLALGHIPSTALPGEEGNVAVAGHRDTIFRGLREIRKNDLIVFETRAGSYAYRVEGMQIVKPSQVNVLKAGHTRELTLVTCYPFRYIGSAPNRFIVKARQVRMARSHPTGPLQATGARIAPLVRGVTYAKSK